MNGLYGLVFPCARDVFFRCPVQFWTVRTARSITETRQILFCIGTVVYFTVRTVELFSTPMIHK